MIADLVPDTSNAYKAGLKRFDQITAVDGIATPFYEEYKKVIDAHKEQEVTLQSRRHIQNAPAKLVSFQYKYIY